MVVIFQDIHKKLKKIKNNATFFLNKSKNLINHFALLNFCFIKYFALCEINALSEIKQHQLLCFIYHFVENFMLSSNLMLVFHFGST
jgi:hypothetical protein